MNMSDKEFDDLTVISGIGPARQKLLRDLLEIKTYQDLVALPADQIVSRLKAEGHIVSRNSIVSWQTEARELGEIEDQPPQPEPPEKDVIKSSINRENGWKPFASFVIEFQSRDTGSEKQERRTMVSHMEEDTGNEWPGIVSRQLCEWIMEQIDEPVDQISEDDAFQPTAEEAEVVVSLEEPAKVIVGDIRLFQPPNASKPAGVLENRKPFAGSLKGRIPFNLEVSFELSGEHADEVIERGVGCLVQSYARESSGREQIHLGDKALASLEKGKYRYTLTLPETTLNYGTYQFWISVGVDNGRTIPNYIEVPLVSIR